MFESYRDGRGKVDSLYFQSCRTKPGTLSSESSCQKSLATVPLQLDSQESVCVQLIPIALHKKNPGIFWIFLAPYPPFWAFPAGIPSDVSQTSSTTTRLPKPVRINLFPHQTHLQPSSRSVFLVFVYKHYRSLLEASSPGVRDGGVGWKERGTHKEPWKLIYCLKPPQELK